MQTAITNPPSSVFFTCVEGIKRHGLNFDQMDANERAFLLEYTAWVATCITSRLTSKLPAPEMCRRASDATALQVRAEALQVLQEAHHLTGGGSNTGGH
jgi:hypothetical protein